MCYNPQMSCDAIEKHNYGLKLLREIKQVGVIETIDFTLSKWTPNRILKEHVQREYPLTSCFAVLFHFQASFERNLVPRVFSLSNMAAAGEKTLAHSELKRSLIGAFHGAFIRALSLVYSFQNKDG